MEVGGRPWFHGLALVTIMDLKTSAALHPHPPLDGRIGKRSAGPPRVGGSCTLPIRGRESFPPGRLLALKAVKRPAKPSPKTAPNTSCPPGGVLIISFPSSFEQKRLTIWGRTHAKKSVRPYVINPCCSNASGKIRNTLKCNDTFQRISVLYEFSRYIDPPHRERYLVSREGNNTALTVSYNFTRRQSDETAKGFSLRYNLI
jgi:hypothetical protein